MTNFIPIFPLNIVVYPTEPLNLHIFEPRYKQLINECIQEKKHFGIPVVMNNGVQEYGTSLEVIELVKEYNDGEMDIKARGVSVFKILHVVKEVPDKMYSGAIVNYPENILEPDDTRISATILTEVKRLYALLNVEEKFPQTDTGVLSYKIAHYTGMELMQEYELLNLLTETQRLEYIRKHLSKMTPMLHSLEQAKTRIKMNGHFRDLSLGDLEL
ncbi:MAG: LON peptidase substrate-binding domain-containing protein [Chitinophagaceae bacterium]|nr:LON peptidase substrate-binding domain-containing protein [Chitinophagaceae bacterium]MCB9046514.1 LON peptidase substrate-binding domain-containing protein [Chitinophagales bacterium]